jgi:MscS family membrane protein
MIKKLFLFFLFLSSLVFGDNGFKYSPFVDSQLKIVYKMNDANITQDEIKELVKKQEIAYERALDELMAQKQKYVKDLRLYNSEIFSLKKIISINKRAGNQYAVLRDEVQLKSYEAVRNQNLMIKNVLLALDSPDIKSFEEKLDEYIVENQTLLDKIYKKDYTDKLALEPIYKTLRQAQKNIKEFYALREVNSDIVNNIYKLENKMYRLNKYSKYHLIKPVVFINSLPVMDGINKILEPYGLTVVKFIFIAIIFLFIYVFRKIIYVALESYILKIDALDKYSHQILEHIQKPIEVIIIVISLNVAVYIYNDFSSIVSVSRFFNIIYVFLITLIIYKVLNAFAVIKLNEINTQSKKIKNELINVGIKILNFIVIMIGILFGLFFVGVDLTAVLGGLGIGGFAVAFAAKDTISNFFGTLSILFSDVFSQGDWIVIDGHEGVVVELGLRVTTIRTFDNALIAIPNGTFASKNIKNWDRRKLGRRIKMSIGVKYDSKSSDIKNAVSQIREMLQTHPDIATHRTKYEHDKIKGAKLVSKDDLEGIKKTLLVYLDEFSDSSINILVYCYSKSVVWQEWLETKEDVMHKIMNILDENSLEFAFPSLSIYNENTKSVDDKA